MADIDYGLLLSNVPYLLWGAFPNGPIGGLTLTVILAVTSGLLSAVLGLAGGIGLALSHGPIRWVLLVIIGFFRAIPVLMLIFWTYFLLPIVFHVDVPGMATVMCALALIGGAYLSHSVRAGVEALPNGQWQAGMSLGLTRVQTLRYVILPQALRVMAPSFINQWVSLIKDTSLAYIVGVPELSFLANQVNSRLMIYPIEIYGFVGLLYLLMCASFDRLASGFSKRRAAQ